MSINAIEARLRALGDRETARQQARFFKTGPGEYGEGDIFIGVRVPVLRHLAKEFKDVALADTIVLLKSPVHEQRLLALLMLINLFNKADERLRQKIYTAYLKHTAYINNWDLVDVSADKILGAYLYKRDKTILYDMAKFSDLWRRRISMMASFYFIKQGQFNPSLRLARMLLKDEHDLIHKAVGWMLREIGKRDRSVAQGFLDKNVAVMPRTMLRYALEKFPPRLRQQYMQK